MAVFTKVSKENIENFIKNYSIGNLVSFEKFVIESLLKLKLLDFIDTKSWDLWLLLVWWLISCFGGLGINSSGILKSTIRSTSVIEATSKSGSSSKTSKSKLIFRSIL